MLDTTQVPGGARIWWVFVLGHSYADWEFFYIYVYVFAVQGIK